MYEPLREHISTIIELTDEEWWVVRSHFTPRALRKHDFLLQAGDVCHAFGFIVKGALYSYTTDGSGGVRVIQFGFEGHGIGDIASFLSREGSSRSIEALEDSELLLIAREHCRLPRI